MMLISVSCFWRMTCMLIALSANEQQFARYDRWWFVTIQNVLSRSNICSVTLDNKTSTDNSVVMSPFLDTKKDISFVRQTDIIM